MTNIPWIEIITTAYFLAVGGLGAYLLYTEWQWLRKETKEQEKD